MALAIALLALGAALVLAGSSGLARAAAGVASARAGSPSGLGAAFLGLNIGTTVVAIYAAARGDGSIAAATLFGGVLFVCSVALPVAIIASGRGAADTGGIPAPEPATIVFPAIVVIGSTLALADSSVGRQRGIGLVAVFLLYLYLAAQEWRVASAGASSLRTEAARGLRLTPWVLAPAGLILAVAGAALMLSGGTRLALREGMSAGLLGAAVLGPLASAQASRLLTRAARAGSFELVTGQVFGTVASSLGAALGVVALVHPLALDGAAMTSFLAAVAVYALVGGAFFWRGRTGRGLALALALTNVGWIWLAARG